MKQLDQLMTILLKFLSMLFLVLLPIRPVMIAVSILVIADFVTGIWAAKKEKQRITSNALRRSVAKTLAYQSTVIVAFIIEKYLLDGMPVVKVVAGLIAITEGKSFFENIHRITGIDFWSEILTKIHNSNAKPAARKRKK